MTIFTGDNIDLSSIAFIYTYQHLMPQSNNPKIHIRTKKKCLVIVRMTTDQISNQVSKCRESLQGACVRAIDALTCIVDSDSSSDADIKQRIIYSKDPAESHQSLACWLQY